MTELGGLEAAVMGVLWDQEQPQSVRGVLTSLTRERKIAYTTVMTVMARLFNKGLLTREARGSAFVYRPVSTRADHTAARMAEVLDADPDRASALLQFTTQISDVDAAALRSALRGVRRRS